MRDDEAVAICDKCDKVVPEVEATTCDGCGWTLCSDCRAKHECGADECRGAA